MATKSTKTSPDAPQPAGEKPNRGGRPRVFADAKVAAVFFRALEYTRSIPRAARIAGVDRDICYRERDRNPEFAAKIETALLSDEFAMLEAVRKHAKNDWRAAAWSLERKQWRRYGRRDPQSVTPEMLNRASQAIVGALLPFVAPEHRDAARDALAVSLGESVSAPVRDADADDDGPGER